VGGFVSVDEPADACVVSLDTDANPRAAASAGAAGADPVAVVALPVEATGDCGTSAPETEAKPCATVLEADPNRTVTAHTRIRYSFFIGRGL
jgi:hypothetical protein